MFSFQGSDAERFPRDVMQSCNESRCSRRVVLHADDLGMSRAVSDGILQGFEQGLLTSASVLTNGPDAHRALGAWQILAQAQQGGHLPSKTLRRRLDDPRRAFDLGVHLNLTQGRPLTRDFPSELLDEDGRFPGPLGFFRRLHRHGRRLRRQIEAELSTQVEVLLDHGLSPTHLNGHQYIEMMPVVSSLIPRLVEQYAIPAVRVPLEHRAWPDSWLPGLRAANALLSLVKRIYARRFAAWVRRRRIPHADVFFGSSHAGLIDLRLMRRFLALRRSFSLAEVAMHPGANARANDTAAAGDGWDDPLAELRPRELKLLTSPELAEIIERNGLRLGRFGDLAA